MANIRNGAMEMQVQSMNVEPEITAQVTGRRQFRLFVSFVIGMVGFLVSIGDLVTKLLAANGPGVIPGKQTLGLIAIAAAVFLVHALLTLRLIILAHKKGKV